ncbi:MAG: hypothetical protein RQ826_07710 [Xanthomonadales bacterium]|nr:hypothetical protein [Xanthomonadales bacterium]
MSLFKLIRIVILLSFLFVLVAGTWMTERRMASWERPILVTVYPVAADDTPSTRNFVEAIEESYFDEVNRFFAREALPYGFQVTPAFRFQLAPVTSEMPPPIPDLFSPVKVALWSLKMRWWSWLKDFRNDLVRPDVQMFVLYQGRRNVDEVSISVGMRKGRYGIVKAFASESMNSHNRVIFTHELLHVLGATDKYSLSTGEPQYPFGYANPDQQPLFPQTRAEIMGGRIPLTAYSSAMPASLEYCKIGRQTAEEIGFFAKLLD